MRWNKHAKDTVVAWKSYLFSESDLKVWAKQYNIHLKTEEVLVTRNFLARKTEVGCGLGGRLSVHNLWDSEMFQTLKATIQVGLKVPVSGCSHERSFSALRRLHTWLRQTMAQKRLHSLAVVSIEKEALRHPSHNTVTDFPPLKTDFDPATKQVTSCCKWLAVAEEYIC